MYVYHFSLLSRAGTAVLQTNTEREREERTRKQTQTAKESEEIVRVCSLSLSLSLRFPISLSVALSSPHCFIDNFRSFFDRRREPARHYRSDYDSTRSQSQSFRPHCPHHFNSKSAVESSGSVVPAVLYRIYLLRRYDS